MMRQIKHCCQLASTALRTHKYLMTFSNPMYLAKRANTTTEWLPSDTPDRYSGVTPSGPNLYRPGDIEYKFNSQGFRCEEFDIDSDLPVVFLGCSVTEGTGLPLYETWSYLLLDKIRKKTNLNIPYWSLGLAQTGIDTQARLLYLLTTAYTKKAKFVFGLFPMLGRREYKIHGPDYKNWLPTWTPAHQPLAVHINHVFSDKYFEQYQAERSLMLLDSVCRANDAKLCCSSWEGLSSIDLVKICTAFPLIDSFPTSFLVTDHARDGWHPGPKYHRAVAELYWEHIEHYFNLVP